MSATVIRDPSRPDEPLPQIRSRVRIAIAPEARGYWSACLDNHKLGTVRVISRSLTEPGVWHFLVEVDGTAYPGWEMWYAADELEIAEGVPA